jgi:ADP-ribose pyrophosphatase YjhB (NUDIX family)
MRRRVMTRVYAAFGRLPRGLRRRIVRSVSPKFTVGAVCFVVREDGRVLLVRHSYNRRWGTAGGLAKRREPPRIAAVREAREEVGLEVELVGHAAVVVEPVLRRVDVVYLARPVEDAQADRARPTSAEILEVGWFALDDLPDISTETAMAWAALSASSEGRTVPAGGRDAAR